MPSLCKSLLYKGLFPLFFLFIAIKIQADVHLNLLNTPWIFNNVTAWDERTCRFDVVNATNLLRKVEGLRFTVPYKPTTFVSYDNPAVDVFAVNDGNGPDRYTARISGMNTGGTAYLNAINANSSLSIGLTCSGIQNGRDFTPIKHQYLVKTGSFTGDKGYKDAPPIPVDIIDSLIALPWFYDTELYVPDSLGIQGGTYTGGFIDTWYDQEGDSSLWQIQIGLPADYFTVNGEPAKYRPDLMGQNDASGAGPLYAMSLAIAQEYMNVDMQIIAGCSPNESYGGVEMFTDVGGPDFVSQGCKYIANKGASGGTGPANIMDAPYNENVYVSYPKFLPYATNPGNPDEFCATPGAGASCLGNSPQMANALLISSLYMWNTYDRMTNATDFWAKDLFNKAQDQKITAKMVLSAWNKGNNYPYEDVMEYQPQNANNSNYNDVIQSVSNMADVTNEMAADYLSNIFPALNPMLDACINSENNGGNCKIHDDSISLEYVEQLFFGMSGNGLTPDPDNGILGAGGILWHFNMSEEERAQLWADVKTAFNKLKGKSPSTQGTDLISFRYDLLVILRVAKQYLDLDRPIPSDMHFTQWVEEHSQKTPVVPVQVENVYPHLLIAEKGVTAQNDFFLRLVIADNGNLDVDKEDVVEWTIDSLWEDWYPGIYLSGDTNNAEYKIVIPAKTIADNFTGREGYGWVRVNDRCGNSTVEKFKIEGVKYPSIASAIVEDTEGDGIGDIITIDMIKGTADSAYEIDSWDSFKYAWPDKIPLNDADPNNTTVNNTTVTVVDNTITTGAGEGLVQFVYAVKDTVRGDLLDRVGPALTGEAILKAKAQLNEPDSLTVTFTEQIDENLNNNTAYLKFDPDGPLASDIAIKQSNTKWIFVFPSGTVEGNDSVNLVTDTNNLIIDGLIAYYPFNGNANDESGNGHNGTVHGCELTEDKDGIANSAYWFRMEEYVEVPNEEDLNITEAITMAAWVNRSTPFDKWQAIITKEHTASMECPYAMLILYGKLHVLFDRNIENLYSDTEIPPNEWVHVAATWDGKNVSFYINGVKDAKEPVYQEKLNVSNGNLVIGFDRPGNPDYFNGKIDEVYLFNRALTEDEIGYLYNGSVNNIKTVVDLKDNFPHTNNQKVPIIIKGNESPSWVTGYIQDTTGNGYGNKITVRIQPGPSDSADQPSDCEKYEYSWPTQNNFITANLSDITIIGNDLIVYDNTFTDGDGSGYAVLRFPHDTALGGDILDKVGPALIDSAILLDKQNAGDPDSLIVTFSEPIKENLLINTSYIKVNDVPEVSLSASKYSGETVWLFDFPANTVKGGDSVNLVTDTGGLSIDGLVAYYPFSGNANDKSGYENHGTVHGPTLTNDRFDNPNSAYSFDGTDDYIEVPHSKSLDVTGEITLAAWICPEEMPEYCTHIVGKMVNNFGSDWYGSYWLPINGVNSLEWGFAISTNPGAIDHWSEKDAPLKRWSFVAATFNESLDEIKIYLDGDLTTTFTETKKLTSNDINVFIGTDNKHTSDHPKYYKGLVDDIRIYNKALSEDEIKRLYNGISEDSTITVVDLIDNPPLDINQKVPVVKLENLSSVKEGFYRDADADGRIDMAEFIIDVKPDGLPTEINLTNPFDGSDIKTVLSDDIAWKNNDPATLTIIVTLDTPFPYSHSTYFTESDYGQIVSGDFIKEPFNIKDGVAPVVDSATYHPGKIIDTKTLERALDTLVVDFTENVTGIATGVCQPFKLITTGATNYYFDLTAHNSIDSIVTFVVAKDGIHGVEYPVNGDSIWIDETDGITDVNSNVQDVADNRHAPLRVLPKPHVIDIKVLTPFMPVTVKVAIPDLNNIEDSEIEKLIVSGGLIITVDFLTDLSDLVNMGKINCKIQVFDPVGNLVTNCNDINDKSGNIQIGLRTTVDYDFTQIVIYWNGCNENDRIVGQGTYLGEIVIDVDGNKKKGEVRIGVKR